MYSSLLRWISAWRARFAPRSPAIASPDPSIADAPKTAAEKRKLALDRLQRRARQLLLVEDLYVFALVGNGLVVVGLAVGWLLSPGSPELGSGSPPGTLDPWVAELSPSTLLWSLGWVPGSWLYEQARHVRNLRRWTRAAQLALASGDHRAKELVVLCLRGR